MKSLAFLLLATFGLVAAQDVLKVQEQGKEPVLVAEDESDGCEDDWKNYDDSCYLRVMSTQTWEVAEHTCEEKGASLVTVNDQAEMDFLKDLMGKNGGWNGLNNQADINKFEWSSGESSEYRYWGTNEPKKNQKKRCVHMTRTKEFKWKMVECSKKYRFICEKAAAEKLPEPVALFPLNGTYGTKEIYGRQPDGIPSDVKLAPGPDGAQNGSYEFNGTTNSHIEFPNNGGLDMNESYTLLCWVYPSGRYYYSYLLVYYDVNTSGFGFGIGYYKYYLFSFLGTGGYFKSKVFPLPSKKWSYVGASYNRGIATLYVNGVVAATKMTHRDTSIATQHSLMAGYVGGRLDTPYDGRIAWIQLYDVALSEEQAKAVAHYTG